MSQPIQPDGEPIWVYDHTEECGTLYRVRESVRTTFENNNRGTCPTCLQALPAARPATAEDWQTPAP